MLLAFSGISSNVITHVVMCSNVLFVEKNCYQLTPVIKALTVSIGNSFELIVILYKFRTYFNFYKNMKQILSAKSHIFMPEVHNLYAHLLVIGGGDVVYSEWLTRWSRSTKLLYAGPG